MWTVEIISENFPHTPRLHQHLNAGQFCQGFVDLPPMVDEPANFVKCVGLLEVDLDFKDRSSESNQDLSRLASPLPAVQPVCQ